MTIVPDSVSRISSETDGKGQKTTYTYDSLDRIKQILYGGATSCSSSSVCTTFTYDADGNLKSRTDSTGTTNYTYDNLNRLLDENLPGNADACKTGGTVITWSYDLANNVTSQCDGSGNVTYGYDPANNLTSEAQPGGSCTGTVSLCTTFAYNADNNRKTTTYPGSATLNITYDNDQNESAVVGKNSSGVVLTSFSYTYVKGTNGTSLRQTMTEADPSFSGTATYTYNALNRLTAATGGPGGNGSYGYDPNGNRTASPVGASTYNADNQLTSSPGVTSYGDDQDGNLVSNSAGASFSYNAKNQTTSITFGGQTLSNLTYADVGQSDRTAAGSSTYASGAQGILTSTNGSTTTYYLRDNTGHLLGEEIGSSDYYYLTDGLGSVVAVITGSGTVDNRYGYDPYGQSISQSASVANPWRYAEGYLGPNRALSLLSDARTVDGLRFRVGDRWWIRVRC